MYFSDKTTSKKAMTTKACQVTEVTPDGLLNDV